MKRLNQEPDEAKALIQNALGFALAAQKDYEGAVRHYKLALRAKKDYPVALNNLAFAQDKAPERRRSHQPVQRPWRWSRTTKQRNRV